MTYCLFRSYLIWRKKSFFLFDYYLISKNSQLNYLKYIWFDIEKFYLPTTSPGYTGSVKDCIHENKETESTYQPNLNKTRYVYGALSFVPPPNFLMCRKMTAVWSVHAYWRRLNKKILILRRLDFQSIGPLGRCFL